MVRNVQETPTASPVELAVPRASLVAGILGSLASFVRKKPLGAIGAVILVIAVLMAVFAPVLATFPPKEVHVTSKYAPPGSEAMPAEGKTYLLGSDQLGPGYVEPAGIRRAHLAVRKPDQCEHRRNGGGAHRGYQRLFWRLV